MFLFEFSELIYKLTLTDKWKVDKGVLRVHYNRIASQWCLLCFVFDFLIHCQKICPQNACRIPRSTDLSASPSPSTTTLYFYIQFSVNFYVILSLTPCLCLCSALYLLLGVILSLCCLVLSFLVLTGNKPVDCGLEHGSSGPK